MSSPASAGTESSESPGGEVSRRLFLGGVATTAAAATLATDARGQSAEQVNVEAFISGVRAARVFDLGFNWDQSSPVLSVNPPYAFALNATHRQTYEIFGTAPGSQVSWILRPFIGSPDLAVQFLRHNALHGNFYETVFNSFIHVLNPGP